MAVIAMINIQKLSFYNNVYVVYGPSITDRYKTANIDFFTSWAVDIIRSFY